MTRTTTVDDLLTALTNALRAEDIPAAVTLLDALRREDPAIAEYVISSLKMAERGLL